MPLPTVDRPHRWDHAPLEETLDGAGRLTVSVADALLRNGWEELARQVGIPRRRWRRFHPLGDGPALALVDGRPAFDAAAWERFASLAPGSLALPSRTASTFGVARSAMRPPDRRLRALDLVAARRRRRRMRRTLRDLEAEHARFRAALSEAIEAALAPGDGAAPWEELPSYALAARFEGLLQASAHWSLPPVVDLLAADATRELVQLLVDRGRPPGDALLQAASLQSGGGIPVPSHVRELVAIAAIDDEATRAARLADWREGPAGWHAMREQPLEAPPLRDFGDDVLALATAEPAQLVPAPLPDPDAPLAAAIVRARSLTARREEVARDRSDFHAAARALSWTLARALERDGAIARATDAFDLSLEELLAAARGATLRPLPAHSSIAPRASAPPATGLVDGPSSTGRVELRGIPASAGSARGRVLVVVEPRPDLDVDGAILFCRSTDPAWMPLLARCAALVTERGGPLSHAAIVARELRLPAVVGTRGAIDAAGRAGEALVDGASGFVTLDP